MAANQLIRVLVGRQTNIIPNVFVNLVLECPHVIGLLALQASCRQKSKVPKPCSSTPSPQEGLEDAVKVCSHQHLDLTLVRELALLRDADDKLRPEHAGIGAAREGRSKIER